MSLNDVRDVYLEVVLFSASHLSSVPSQPTSSMYHGVGGLLGICYIQVVSQPVNL